MPARRSSDDAICSAEPPGQVHPPPAGGEQGVAAEQEALVAGEEAHRPLRVTRRVEHVQRRSPNRITPPSARSTAATDGGISNGAMPRDGWSRRSRPGGARRYPRQCGRPARRCRRCGPSGRASRRSASGSSRARRARPGRSPGTGSPCRWRSPHASPGRPADDVRRQRSDRPAEVLHGTDRAIRGRLSGCGVHRSDQNRTGPMGHGQPCRARPTLVATSWSVHIYVKSNCPERALRAGARDRRHRRVVTGSYGRGFVRR